MTNLKNLRVGKRIEDLDYKLPDSIRNFDINKLCNSCKTLLTNAKRNMKEGDEEMAYIFYMKYLNMINYIQNRPEFHKQKEFVSKYLGRVNTDHAIENAERLALSLRRRYDLLNAAKNSEIRRLEEENRSPVFDGQDIEKEVTKPSIFINSNELYQMIQNGKISMLIIDCRPENDFQNLKIIYHSVCNVPEEIIRLGMTAGKIQNDLPAEMKALYSSRLFKEKIVLIDWISKSDDASTRNETIWILRDILLNWDQDCNYKNPILVVDGGLELFTLHYPMFTTNPNYRPPSIGISQKHGLGDIEYPSLLDIDMKDSLMSRLERRNQRPTVDRSSKGMALKVLQERELLANNVVENAKAVLDAQTKLSQIQIVQDLNNKNIDEHIEAAREEELQYQILEMKNQQRDYKIRIQELEQEISSMKSSKPKNDVGGQRINEDEAIRLEKEAEKRIAMKEQEERMLVEKSKSIEAERESKLVQTRKWPKPIVLEELNKPKEMPIFDRSIKPSAVSTNLIYRDFSPERGCKGKGLTGLKNLGNTCYMNSIMQCLSNTDLLADYLINDNYKSHINRSNQTKGKIAEEVSAMLKEIWCAQYKYISSKNFRNIVGEFHPLFRGMEQQDSHEFLTILMDWLHSDLQFVNKTDIPKGILTPAEKAWEAFIESKESYILKLFYGQIKSTVKCKVCQMESATYEGFSNLSLELPANYNRCDIDDCLQMYFFGEEIRGWNCPTCKEKRSAIKKLDISKLPPILVIHFKRFCADTDSYSNTFKKKQTYVDFPLTNFDVRKYIAPSEAKPSKNFNYNLYGVSNHYGVLERGHCTAFCKSRIFNKWYKFDDHRVSEIDESNVVSSAAYILFYTTHDGGNYKTNNKL